MAVGRGKKGGPRDEPRTPAQNRRGRALGSRQPGWPLGWPYPTWALGGRASITGQHTDTMGRACIPFYPVGNPDENRCGAKGKILKAACESSGTHDTGRQKSLSITSMNTVVSAQTDTLMMTSEQGEGEETQSHLQNTDQKSTGIPRLFSGKGAGKLDFSHNEMFITGTSKDILQEGERAQKGHGERTDGEPHADKGERGGEHPRPGHATVKPHFSPGRQTRGPPRGSCSAFTPWQVQAEPDTRPLCSHSGKGFLYLWF